MKDQPTVPNVERKQQHHHESPSEESSQGAAGLRDLIMPRCSHRKSGTKGTAVCQLFSNLE